MRFSRQLRAGLLTLALALASSVQAAAIEGQNFADAANVGDASLQLNGVGLRTRVVFKVYAAGLYLSEKATTGAAIHALKGPKRIDIRMLRDVEGETFKKSLVDGVKANASGEAFAAMQGQVKQMEALIDAVGNLKKGDAVVIDFVPGRGTSIALNGTAKGSPVAGDDFSKALLSVFVGDKPADDKLKKGLLGG